MEMDWLEGQEEFTRAACAAYDFDYLLGSVHFIRNWGFDDGAGPWKAFSQEECEARYQAYFTAWEQMLSSGLFNIAAHPDLIKIFSVEQFHIWLAKPESLQQLRRCLTTLRNAGMAMEISSAGLRKACREIYPAPPIMALAAELRLPVSFASDAHSSDDVAYGFARLASYAKAFGFTEHVIFGKRPHDHAAFLTFFSWERRDRRELVRSFTRECEPCRNPDRFPHRGLQGPPALQPRRWSPWSASVFFCPAILVRKQCCTALTGK